MPTTVWSGLEQSGSTRVQAIWEERVWLQSEKSNKLWLLNAEPGMASRLSGILFCRKSSSHFGFFREDTLLGKSF
jgi:hypothetical protein